MAVAKARGAKRKCQNEECGLPFYDLNRASFNCPNCGASFDLDLPKAEADPRAAYPFPRKPREFRIAAPDEPKPDDKLKADNDDDGAELPATTSGDQVLLDEDDEDVGDSVDGSNSLEDADSDDDSNERQ